MFLLRTVTFFNLVGDIYIETTCLIQDDSSPSLFRNQEMCFWSTTPAKLCWLFRAILRNLIPRNIILGVFIRMALIYSPEYISEISQGLTTVLSVLFCFLK